MTNPDARKVIEAREVIKKLSEDILSGDTWKRQAVPEVFEALQLALSIMQGYEGMKEKYSQEIMKNTMLEEERDDFAKDAI